MAPGGWSPHAHVCVPCLCRVTFVRRGAGTAGRARLTLSLSLSHESVQWNVRSKLMLNAFMYHDSIIRIEFLVRC